MCVCCSFFFFSSRRRHTRFDCDWSSDVCSSDLLSTLNSQLTVRRCGRRGGSGSGSGARQAIGGGGRGRRGRRCRDRKSTRLNSSHSQISYAVFCLKKKKKTIGRIIMRRKNKGSE